VRRPFCLVACAVLAGCGGGGGGPPKPSSAPSATRPATTAQGCRRIPPPARKPTPKLSAPRGRLDPARTWTATVRTSCGTFAIRLDVRHSPRTTASFAALARRGFYDGLTFHRIVPGFVIQGGDPRGDGLGGPGYTVVEPPPAALHYVRDIVAMAKKQTEPPGASGSQVFVVTAEDATTSAGLTPEYALLGGVSRGRDVVARIGDVPAAPATGKPRDPVVIRRVTISGG
jgi:cyclophilin family peptidyl-prolyl cis-trans isomerase